MPATRVAGKPCRAHQRQVQPDARCFDKADYFGDKLFEARIPANQLGVRKAVLQITYKFVGIVAKQNRADAAIALGNEDRSEGTFANGKADFSTGAAGTIAAWHHAKNLIRLFIKPAVGIVARIENCVCHGAATAEFIAYPLFPLCPGILLWR